MKPIIPLPGRVLAAIAVLALLAPARAAAPAESWWTNLKVRTLAGEAVTPADGGWIVLVFITPECPLANASVPVLNALAREFGPRGFTFVGAYVDPTLPPAVLARHTRDYALAFATTDDRDHRLVRLAGATYTPEAFVFTADGTRLYRGRIDDRVGDFGAARPTAVRQDLREVLTALTGGLAGPFPDGPGFGCAIPEEVKP